MTDLSSDPAAIEQFVASLFRYADPETFISLRTFDQHERGGAAVAIEGVRVGSDPRALAGRITKAATKAANIAPPTVFAPPVATFAGPTKAATADLANGVAISVEIDTGDTAAKRRRLEHLLGPVTVAVHSGGEWTDPQTGEIHPKAHLHWRLSEPTREPADHEKLRLARKLAALLVDADATAAPPVHPLRWPGSWNLKASPRLATIAAGNPASEVHLEDVLERLQEAVEAAGVGGVSSAPRTPGTPQAPVAALASAILAIPNPDLSWDDWNRMGMAMWRASDGCLEGLHAWQEWSAKSAKHHDATCVDRWHHFTISPPTKIGAGTIFLEAGRNGWERHSSDPPPDIDDPGYHAAIDQAAMSAGEWAELEQRETGTAIPASPEAKAQAGKNLLWRIDQPWAEQDIPLRPWIARGYLMRRSITVVSGAGSAGKSSLMVAWATALAIGCKFHGLRSNDPVRVATYNVEDDGDEQKRRFSAMLQQLECRHDALGGRLVILGPSRVGTLLHTTRDGALLVNTPVMDELEQFTIDFKPDVLILDPFVELHAAEENDNTAVRAVMARFRAMAIDHDLALVLLHHSRKGGTDPGDPDSLRGASAIVGAARVALTLNVMTPEEADTAGIHKDKRRNYFRLDGAKNNYAPIEEAEWFERLERKLSNGTETDGDGVAVVWPWKPASPFRDLPTHDINQILDQIAAAAPDNLYAPVRKGRDNTRWCGNLLVQHCGLTPGQAKTIIDQWLRSGLLATVEFRNAHREQRAGVVVVDTHRPK